MLIKKAIKIYVAQDAIFKYVSNYKMWPEWIPDLKQVTVVSESGGCCVLKLSSRDKYAPKTLELVCSGTSLILLKQVDGYFKKYLEEIRFYNKGDPNEVNVVITIDVVCSGWVPKSMVLKEVSRYLQKTMKSLKDKLEVLEERKDVAVPCAAEEVEGIQKILTVIQKPDKLEILFLGKRYEFPFGKKAT
jgi:uncharacterized membrane protein